MADAEGTRSAGSDRPDPDFSRARADAVVAGGAAAATVALTLALRFGAGADAPLVARLSPMAVYAVYLAGRRFGAGGRLDAPRYWAALAFAVAAVAFLVLAR
jgi:hypothetical protein